MIMNINSREFPLPKSEWGEGEWQNEPDRLEWIDEYSGYPCIAKRVMTGGHWCGYVGIPKGHKYHGKSHGDCDVIEAPGGITYGSECDGKPGIGVCHIADSEEDDVWWLGFDCAHWNDYQPAMEAYCGKVYLNRDHKDVYNYKTLAFVQNECTKLAKQLKEIT